MSRVTVIFADEDGIESYREFDVDDISTGFGFAVLPGTVEIGVLIADEE
jgi:hypothetical protein